MKAPAIGRIAVTAVCLCGGAYPAMTAERTLPWSFVNGSAKGYSIHLVSASPTPGTKLAAGQPVDFKVTVSYELSIAGKGAIVLVVQDESNNNLRGKAPQQSQSVDRGKGTATLTESFTVPTGVDEVRLFVPLVPEGFKHTDGEVVLRYPVSSESAAVGDPPTAPAAVKAEPAVNDQGQLLEGRKVLSQGNPQKAIVEYFDPVILRYESLYKDSPKHIYSAQNQVEMIIYAALPDDRKRDIEVLDGTWSNAYLMKAYALTELNKLNDAQAALGSAIALSPLNSQFISELAYTYQAQKNCEKSIATYVQASSAAELGSDDTTKTVDLTRAWRGQGYCLVEQGKFDEAEAMYKKCLALDPKDNKARGELEYIKGLRKK